MKYPRQNNEIKLKSFSTTSCLSPIQVPPISNPCFRWSYSCHGWTDAKSPIKTDKKDVCKLSGLEGKGGTNEQPVHTSQGLRVLQIEVWLGRRKLGALTFSCIMPSDHTSKGCGWTHHDENRSPLFLRTSVSLETHFGVHS